MKSIKGKFYYVAHIWDGSERGYINLGYFTKRSLAQKEVDEKGFLGSVPNKSLGFTAEVKLQEGTQLVA